MAVALTRYVDRRDHGEVSARSLFPARRRGAPASSSLAQRARDPLDAAVCSGFGDERLSCFLRSAAVAHRRLTRART